MNFRNWINESWTESIKLNKNINNSKIIYSKLSEIFPKNTWKTLNDETFLIGTPSNKKTNILFICVQHGTENSAPWALIDFYKQNKKFKNINICSIPILNVKSFNKAKRDITKDDDLAILNNLNYLNKFDYVFSFHEDHNSLKDEFYIYGLGNIKFEYLKRIKNSIEYLGLVPSRRFTYTFANHKGIFYDKRSEFPEEHIDANFIRSEISGKLNFEEKKDYQLKIMNILLNEFEDGDKNDN